MLVDPYVASKYNPTALSVNNWRCTFYGSLIHSVLLRPKKLEILIFSLGMNLYVLNGRV
jgi:hypothetical protein